MDTVAIVGILGYVAYAAYHGATIAAAKWNATEAEHAVWVLLAVFFLWLLHGIEDIRKPVDVFIGIVVLAIAMMQYKNVSSNLASGWGVLVGNAQGQLASGALGLGAGAAP